MGLSQAGQVWGGSGQREQQVQGPEVGKSWHREAGPVGESLETRVPSPQNSSHSVHCHTLPVLPVPTHGPRGLQEDTGLWSASTGSRARDWEGMLQGTIVFSCLFGFQDWIFHVLSQERDQSTNITLNR